MAGKKKTRRKKAAGRYSEKDIAAGKEFRTYIYSDYAIADVIVVRKLGGVMQKGREVTWRFAQVSNSDSHADFNKLLIIKNRTNAKLRIKYRTKSL